MIEHDNFTLRPTDTYEDQSRVILSSYTYEVNAWINCVRHIKKLASRGVYRSGNSVSASHNLSVGKEDENLLLLLLWCKTGV